MLTSNDGNNMEVAELGVVEKQQQVSQLAAWLDEEDDTGGEQPILSPLREARVHI